MRQSDSVSLITNYFPKLTNEQIYQFEALKEIYADWNQKINVISRKDIDQFYTRHVLHSLSIAKFVSFRSKSKILDVGTGGGFPGIPLAIYSPKSSFTLVDSIGKKIKVYEFKDFPEFRPNLSPREIFLLGSFGGTYWRPIDSSVKNKNYCEAKGNMFDSSMYEKFHHKAPFDFVLGKGKVIKGWEIGLHIVYASIFLGIIVYLFIHVDTTTNAPKIMNPVNVGIILFLLLYPMIIYPITKSIYELIQYAISKLPKDMYMKL